MSIIVSGRHLEVSDAVKEYVQNKVSPITEGYNKVNKVSVVLDVQKSRYSAEIIVHGKHINIEADAEKYDLYEAIDAAILKVDKQIRKYFDKVQAHHKTEHKGKKQKAAAKKKAAVEDSDESED